MSISAKDIAQMSKEEKIRVMEAIWADLTQTEADVESPSWHAEALRKTDDDLSSGKEEVLDWNDAKRELRKRFD